MFFNNGDIYKEFDADNHYIGPTGRFNCLAPSFHVVVDCYKGFMVLVCVGNEEYTKLIWLVKALLLPNFFSNKL